MAPSRMRQAVDWLSCDGSCMASEPFACQEKVGLASMMHPDVTEERLMKYLIAHKGAEKDKACPKCDVPMKLQTTVERRGSEKERTAWRCMKCKSRFSARGMYYANYKDPVRIFIVQYMIMHDYPTDIIQHELGLQDGKMIAEQTECIGTISCSWLEDKFHAEEGTWGDAPRNSHAY